VALEIPEGGDCVVFALEPIDMAGAAAVTGVVEDEGGDAILSQEALDGEPLRGDFADSVADEKGGFRKGGFDVDGVEEVFAAGNRVASYGQFGADGASSGDAAEEMIAKLHEAAGDGESDRECEAVEHLLAASY